MLTLSQLEEEAKKRKERLQQWKIDKTTKRKELDGDEENEEEQRVIEFPKPIFRNYKPRDLNQLSGAILLPRPELVDVKSWIDDQLKEKKTNVVGQLSDDVDLMSLAPRKPDWDLKRDVEKKLKRLDKRTARAIGELTRERLLNEQKQSLAELVATTSTLNQDDEE